MLNREVELLEI